MTVQLWIISITSAIILSFVFLTLAGLFVLWRMNKKNPFVLYYKNIKYLRKLKVNKTAYKDYHFQMRGRNIKAETRYWHISYKGLNDIVLYRQIDNYTTSILVTHYKKGENGWEQEEYKMIAPICDFISLYFINKAEKEFNRAKESKVQVQNDEDLNEVINNIYARDSRESKLKVLLDS